MSRQLKIGARLRVGADGMAADTPEQARHAERLGLDGIFVGDHLKPAGPYPEISGFLKTFPHLYEQAFRTLSYCDGMNLAPWIKCRTVISNCLWDDVCPPSTVFAVYHHMTAEKQIEIYPFHKHEIPYEHNETKFRLIMETLRP